MTDNKEIETHNMLTYLANKHTGISSHKSNVFTLDFCPSIFIEQLSKKDDYTLTLDFNTKTISVYSYCESYHNGDHYDCDTTQFDWKLISSVYDTLISITHSVVEKEVVKQLHAKLTEDRLQKIISGL